MHAAAATAAYCSAAAAISTLAAVPFALLVERRRTRLSVLLERSTYIVLALPGLVVALALGYFSVRYFPQLYQSSSELVFTYAIMFFPLALVVMRGSVAQAPAGLEDVARTLGHGRALGASCGHAAAAPSRACWRRSRSSSWSPRPS